MSDINNKMDNFVSVKQEVIVDELATNNQEMYILPDAGISDGEIKPEFTHSDLHEGGSAHVCTVCPVLSSVT